MPPNNQNSVLEDSKQQCKIKNKKMSNKINQKLKKQRGQKKVKRRGDKKVSKQKCKSDIEKLSQDHSKLSKRMLIDLRHAIKKQKSEF